MLAGYGSFKSFIIASVAAALSVSFTASSKSVLSLTVGECVGYLHNCMVLTVQILPSFTSWAVPADVDIWRREFRRCRLLLPLMEEVFCQRSQRMYTSALLLASDGRSKLSVCPGFGSWHIDGTYFGPVGSVESILHYMFRMRYNCRACCSIPLDIGKGYCRLTLVCQ